MSPAGELPEAEVETYHWHAGWSPTRRKLARVIASGAVDPGALRWFAADCVEHTLQWVEREGDRDDEARAALISVRDHVRGKLSSDALTKVAERAAGWQDIQHHYCGMCSPQNAASAGAALSALADPAVAAESVLQILDKATPLKRGGKVRDLILAFARAGGDIEQFFDDIREARTAWHAHRLARIVLWTWQRVPPPEAWSPPALPVP